MIGLEISTLFFIDRVDSFKKKKKGDRVHKGGLISIG